MTATEDELPKRLNELTLSDDRVFTSHLRIAYRFAERYEGAFLFVAGLGWHMWDSTRWVLCVRGEVEQALFALLKEMWSEAMTDNGLQRDIKSCHSAGGTDSVLKQASRLETFACVPSDMDGDPYLVNVANGTLDLHTGQLREHDPRDRMTSITRAAFNWEASRSTWEGVLTKILPDPEVRGFLQRYVGVALVGKVLEHSLVILKGPGGNGKSTFYDAVSFALGDYAMSAEPELFMVKDGAHPTGQMDLFGKRWVVTSETDQGRRLAAATVKRLTGGDVIRARKLYKDFVEFSPSHTSVMVTNHLPKVTGNDPALWRRIRVVNFDVVIPKEQQLSTLDEMLHAEADGILSWAYEGWVEYTVRGHKLDEPAAVLAATSDYRSESDDVQRFIEEFCEVIPGAKTPIATMYAKWMAWAQTQRATIELTKRGFVQEMVGRGFVGVAGTGGTKCLSGIV